MPAPKNNQLATVASIKGMLARDDIKTRFNDIYDPSYFRGNGGCHPHHPKGPCVPERLSQAGRHKDS